MPRASTGPAREQGNGRLEWEELNWHLPLFREWDRRGSKNVPEEVRKESTKFSGGNRKREQTINNDHEGNESQTGQRPLARP